MMPRPDLVQGALIAYLKTKTEVTTLLSSSDEIKEHQWQGRDFDYPAIRLNLNPLNPSPPDCEYYEISFSWLVFSEEASSYEANKISGIISSVLHGKSFSQTIQGVDLNLSLWTNSIVPAIRMDERTWRSEILMRGTASG